MRTNESMNAKPRNEQVNEEMKGQTNEWMDECANELMTIIK